MDGLTAISASMLFLGDQALAMSGTELSMPALVQSVARALECSIAASPKEGERTKSVFDSCALPTASVRSYLRRLQRTFQCCGSTFVGSLVILDRFLVSRRARREEPQYLTDLNVHRLFLTCLLVSVKFNEDCVFKNSQYAKAGGLHVHELNQLERLLAEALDFNLRVHPAQYQLYEHVVQRLSAAPSPSAARKRIVEGRHSGVSTVTCCTAWVRIQMLPFLLFAEQSLKTA